MRKIELLAPAGNMESFYAAVKAGCDAVYLGGYLFGARNFAGNFSNEEIIEVINYAHTYGVKVYVTVNTIVYEEEVETFLNYIDFLHKNNVDAVIIQDIGMLDLVRKTYPNLEIHASTQMHIHNIEGVKLLEKLNIKRAVLARETKIEVIKEIKNKTNVDLEIFVHGALCVSYSGQCLMSSLIGNRSGNRGTCTQSCRKTYDLLDLNNKKLNKDSYLLSMKDLNTLEHIDKLLDANIDSLKIEGRMKRPEYVYLVVSTYRKAIDNYLLHGKTNITESDIIELKKIFNRQFTKGFLFNDDNVINEYRPNHMGIKIGSVISSKNKRIKIKLTDTLNRLDGIRIIDNTDYGFTVQKMFLNGKSVEVARNNDIVEIEFDKEVSTNIDVIKTTDYISNKEIQDKIKTTSRKVLIDMSIKIKENEKMELTITDSKESVTVFSSDLITKAINNPTDKLRILEQLKKFGSTPFLVNNIKEDIDSNLYINIKDINQLRRDATELLVEKRLYNISYIKENYNIDVPDFNKEKNINYLVNTINDYNEIKNEDINIIYTNEDLKSKIKDDRLVLKLNRVINNYNEYDESLLVGELGSVNKYKFIDTDFSLNVVNSYSVALLHGLGVNKITLSTELNDKQIEDLITNYKKRYNKQPNLEVIVYGRLEAMIIKKDLLDKYKLDKAYLKDEFNNKYIIEKNNDFVTIYDYKIKNEENIQKYFNMGINNIRYNK